MLIAALFIIAKTYKHHQYLSISKYLSILESSHTMEYYSAKKRNKLFTMS